MKLTELYQQLNGDYADACRRLLSEKMVARFVIKFPDDPSMQNLRDAVAAGDIESSFRAVHTLKGVSGILAFTSLYQAAWNLTEQLRPRLDQADPELLAKVEDEYANTLAALKAYMENPE